MVGPHDLESPTTPVIPNQGGMDLSWFNPNDAQTQTDMAGPGTQQPTTPFVDTSGGGGTSGFTSDTTTNPYYTTGGTFIPEQKPIEAPSDFMVGNVIADALAQQDVNPGYAKSWDYNPKNPDNIIGQSPTLGSIFAVDSSGNPILDSSGNPIKTNYGTDIIDYVQDQLGQQGAVDLSLYGDEGPTGFFENVMSPEDLRSFQDEWWRDYTGPGGGGGYTDYGWNYDDQRQAKLDLISALQGGSPIKNLEQSGFMESMIDPYEEAQKEALNKGIFSGVQIPGVGSKGLQRLIRSYGSGLQSPLYENYAKGGIVGLLGV